MKEYAVKDGLPYYAHLHHIKGPLIDPIYIPLSNVARRVKMNAFLVSQGDTPIDHWCVDYYGNIMNIKHKSGIECPNNFEYFIMGNTTVELHAPDEFWKEFDKFFDEAQHVSNIDLVRFHNEIYYKERKIQLIIYRNKDIAEQIKKNIMRHFETKKKSIKMMFFDVNGVLTPENTIYEVCRPLKTYNEIKEVITIQTLGKMSVKKSFERVGEMIAGLTLKQIVDYANSVKLTSGIKEAGEEIKSKGIKCVIITTGFRPIMEIINKRTGCQFNPIICNDLYFEKDGKELTKKEVDYAIVNNKDLDKIKTLPKVKIVISEPEKKTEYIIKTIEKHGLNLSDCAAVGDSIGDSDMIRLTSSKGGLGIAFNPNTALIEYAHMLKKRNANVEIVKKVDMREVAARV